jgi:DNA-binding NarL/FixJ family response regulator
MKPEQVNTLTRRESEVIAELSKGLYYKEIAGKIFISKETVKKHVKSIYRKMGVRNRVEATIKYVSQQNSVQDQI